jgi:hypothetical protein
MPKHHNSHARAWLYLIAMFVVVSFVVRYGFRLFSQLRGVGEPSLFAQVFTGLMIGFSGVILYGYWAEYRTDMARAQAASRPQYGLGCLLILVIVSSFACGLLVLAWKMYRKSS